MQNSRRTQQPYQWNSRSQNVHNDRRHYDDRLANDGLEYLNNRRSTISNTGRSYGRGNERWKEADHNDPGFRYFDNRFSSFSTVRPQQRRQDNETSNRRIQRFPSPTRDRFSQRRHENKRKRNNRKNQQRSQYQKPRLTGQRNKIHVPSHRHDEILTPEKIAELEEDQEWEEISYVFRPFQTSDTFDQDWRAAVGFPNVSSAPFERTEENRPRRMICERNFKDYKAKFPCIFCGAKHLADQCPIVIDVDDRRKLVLKEGRCTICLGYHQTKHCHKDGFMCDFCASHHLPVEHHHWCLCPEAIVVMPRK